MVGSLLKVFFLLIWQSWDSIRQHMAIIVTTIINKLATATDWKLLTNSYYFLLHSVSQDTIMKFRRGARPPDYHTPVGVRSSATACCRPLRFSVDSCLHLAIKLRWVLTILVQLSLQHCCLHRTVTGWRLVLGFSPSLVLFYNTWHW